MLKVYGTYVMILSILLYLLLATTYIEGVVDEEPNNSFLTECNTHCTCNSVKTPRKIEVKGSDGEVTTETVQDEDFDIACDSFQKLKGLVELETWSPSDLRKVMLTINQVGSDVDSVYAKADCAGTPATEVCFNSGKTDFSKTVTDLIINGGNKLRNLGDKGYPFLILFKDVKELEIHMEVDSSTSGGHTLNIYLVDLASLENLKLSSQGTTSGISLKLYCALCLDECFSNPDGIGTFEFVSSGMPQLLFDEDFKLPNIIENFDYRKKDITGGSGKAWDDKIFRNIEFKDITILYNSNFPLSDFHGASVTGSLKIILQESDMAVVTQKVFQAGLISKLKLEILYQKGSSSSLAVPLAYNSNEKFTRSTFDDCKLGARLLQENYFKMTIYNKKVLVMRGFELKVSDVIKKAKDLQEGAYINLLEIYVYTFHLIVDEEITYEGYWPRWADKVLLHYVDLTAADGIVIEERIFFKLQYRWSSPVAWGDQYKIINYADLKHQFIYMKYTDMPDPVFMTTSAMCLIAEVDKYEENYPEQSLMEDGKFVEWYSRFVDPKDFNSRYTDEEVSRANSMVQNLNHYVGLIQKQIIGNVTRVPFLSLETLTSNVDVLSRAGKDLQEKKRHLETIDAVQIVGEKVDTTLQTILNKIDTMKIDLLETSKRKSETLANIETRKQEDMNTTIVQSQTFITKLVVKFDEYTTKLEKATEDFQVGVKVAMAIAVAEAAAEAVGAITSIFKGGFNPSGAMKAARKVTKLLMTLKKLVKVMKAIAKLMKKGKLMNALFAKVKKAWNNIKKSAKSFYTNNKKILKDFVTQEPDNMSGKSKEAWEKLKELESNIVERVESAKGMVDNVISYKKAIGTVEAGYNPDNPFFLFSGHTDVMQSARTISDKLSPGANALKQLKSEDAKKVAREGNSVNAMDVFKWDIAREHVIAMVDTTLSDDVPEATAYRGALLKFIKAGATRTKAELDLATQQAQFSASKDFWDMYIEEAAITGLKILEIKEAMAENDKKGQKLEDLKTKALEKKKLADLDLDFEIYSIVFKATQVNQEFCNAFFYFHLSKCPVDLRLRVSDSLERVLTAQNELIYQSRQKLADIYPPPQTFSDHLISIKKNPEYCTCTAKGNKELGTIDTSAIEARGDLTAEQKFEAAEKVRYETLQICLETYNVHLPTKWKNAVKRLNRLINECGEDPIGDMIENNQFTFDVGIDSEIFQGYERVRIDDVKVYLVGAKTDDGILNMHGETTGISEDKYNDKCFRFVGERWIRKLSYFSPSAIKPKRGVAAKQGDPTFMDKATVHRTFDGIYRLPTVFTSWTFSLKKEENPGLKLNSLSEIQLTFSGSFTSAPNSQPSTCQLSDKNDEEDKCEL